MKLPDFLTEEYTPMTATITEDIYKPLSICGGSRPTRILCKDETVDIVRRTITNKYRVEDSAGFRYNISIRKVVVQQ